MRVGVGVCDASLEAETDPSPFRGSISVLRIRKENLP